MRKDFLNFLAAEGTIPADRLDDLGAVLRNAPEPIGRIAFSYGMISGSDIDLVLDEQQRDYRRFGEIATSMGMLTREQVEMLLRVQAFRSATEATEALGLAGVCSLEDAIQQLGRFLTQVSLTSVCSTD